LTGIFCYDMVTDMTRSTLQKISILISASVGIPVLAMLIMTLFIAMGKLSPVLYYLITGPAILIAVVCVTLIRCHFNRINEVAETVESPELSIKKALMESRQRLMDIIDFLPDATFVIDSDGKVVIWNNAMEELTGLKAEDILGKGDYEYAIPFYGERRPVLIDLCYDMKCIPENEIAQLYPEIKIINGTITSEFSVPGTIRKGAHLWAIAQSLYDRQGNLAGAIESLRDVTERKVSEEKYATIFRLSPFIISISSVSDGRYIEASDRFYELTGYTKNEVIGRTAFDLNIWADPNDRDRILQSLREQGRVINDEVQFRAKNGEIRTMFFSAEIVVIAEKPCLLAVNVDITQRKIEQEIIKRQNEELLASNEEFEALNEELNRSQDDLLKALRLLRQSEEKLSTSYRLAPVAMTLSRISDGHYIEVSDHFLKLTEYSRDEVLGRTALELNIWNDKADRQRVLGIVTETGIVTDQEIVFQSRSGKKYTMLFSAQIIKISGEDHLASIATDITDRKRALEEKLRLEEELLQAQKMESVGRLAGGVAHDFNNLLTAIMGNTDFALKCLHRGEDITSRLEVVKMAAASAAQLTRQLLAFSRKEPIEPKVTDINKIITGTHKMLARLIGEDIDLRMVTESSWHIKADRGQIEQIIMNLAVNARDAMPDGGFLVIRTENATLDDLYCSNHADAVAGDYVMIAVTDNGMGMDEKVQKNLFEPFYTTKGKGKGTGLGLAMVYGAIKQNRGIIEVYSSLNEGTTFKMYFPRAYDDTDEPRPSKDEESVPTGNETILLVEDDDLVRDYAKQVLENLGYRVREASNGEAALTLFETGSGEIDLLMTDVILPGMNGKILAQTLKEKKPGLKVLYCSGYTEDIIADRGILEKGISFISKPYGFQALARKIRETLDS